MSHSTCDWFNFFCLSKPKPLRKIVESSVMCNFFKTENLAWKIFSFHHSKDKVTYSSCIFSLLLSLWVFHLKGFVTNENGFTTSWFSIHCAFLYVLIWDVFHTIFSSYSSITIPFIWAPGKFTSWKTRKQSMVGISDFQRINLVLVPIN